MEHPTDGMPKRALLVEGGGLGRRTSIFALAALLGASSRWGERIEPLRATPSPKIVLGKSRARSLGLQRHRRRFKGDRMRRRGKYKGSAEAKRATAIGGNPARAGLARPVTP